MARTVSARQTRRAPLNRGPVVVRILLERRGLVSVRVAANAPHVHAAIRVAFIVWFTSPFLASWFALSFVHILRPRAGIEPSRCRATPSQPSFGVVPRLGRGTQGAEAHGRRSSSLATIPWRALFTGIGIFGAVGSGKTTCCMYPLAEQLVAYRRPERRMGGFIELSLGCPYRSTRSTTTSKPTRSPTASRHCSLTSSAAAKSRSGNRPAPTSSSSAPCSTSRSTTTSRSSYECAINPDLLAQCIAEG